MLNEILKSNKMVAAVKIDIKQQEIKKMVAPSYNFSQGYLLLKIETM